MKYTPAIKTAAGVVIRAAIIILCNPLVKHHFITSELLSPAIDDLVNQVVNWLPTGAVITWSWLQKIAAQKKVAIAAALPPCSTPEDVEKVLKITNPGLAKVP